MENKKEFKPLLILGVRQCGKTYIINKFCTNEFKNYKKIYLFEDTKVIDLYKSNKTSDQKYQDLKLLLGFDCDKECSILFIDEIQECEELISELKYFNEKHSNVRIVCAGSLLGVKLAKLKKTFPVGKITRLYMYPMDFEDFLMAFNEDMLIECIKECFFNNKPMEYIHDKALDYYRKYLLSGGMPDSVKEIVEKKNDYYNYDLVILNDIIEDYRNDMNIYNGIITENYVANQLKANGIDLLYWKGSRNSEIDFLISTIDDGIIPIEVKADSHAQSKSLKAYNELYKPKYMIRISSKDFGYNNETKIKSIPLYATFLIKELIK